MRRVIFVGFEGGSCSTVSHPIELFSYALSQPGVEDAVPETRCSIDVVTPHDRSLDRVGFFTLDPTVRMADVPTPDLIFLTGMSSDIEQALVENRQVMAWIKKAHQRGSRVAAVCPSQGLLAASGLLKGKTAAIHWSQYDTFRKKWPEVLWRVDDMVVDEDRVITCCGGSAATDLTLYLIDQMFGEDAMMNCARWFMTDPPRVRQLAPPPLFEMPDITDPKMKNVQEWLHQHFPENLTFHGLAEDFDMTERTFYRHFQKYFGETPKVYLQKLRLAAARRILESNTVAIDEVARRVGYEDTVFFRRIFKRHMGMAPGEYREKFKFRSMQISRAEQESTTW